MENKEYDIFTYVPVVHEPDRAIPEIWRKRAGLVVTDEFEIVIPDGNYTMLINSANDLREYFDISMGIALKVRASEDIEAERGAMKNKIVISSDGYEKLSKEPSEFTVTVAGGGIDVRGTQMRGAMQGGFFVEDEMNCNEGPVISEETFHRRDRFSPRIVHAPMNVERDIAYCDNFIRALAHHDLDLVFYAVNTPNDEARREKYRQYNDIIDRSMAWGVRPYSYSVYQSKYHPDDPDALEHYRSTYGELMKNCPNIFGMIFVGESIEFPSKDPRVSRYSHYDPRSNDDNLPTAGWFTCSDYPEWINMVKRVMREQNPECEFIFWSYNWAYLGPELRLELIRRLPKDITAMATFEMAQEFYTSGGAYVRTDDYTLSYIGPSDYFISESEEARKCGLRMMSMTNSAGKTWDIAGVPYLLAPQRWNLRWQSIIKAQQTYSLDALLESHNYGWRPSIISEIGKDVYRLDGRKFEVLLRRVVERDFMAAAADEVIEAFALCSDALGHCIPSGCDQYGPSRIGPAYPFIFDFDKPGPLGSFHVLQCGLDLDYDRFDDDQMALGVNEYGIMAKLLRAAAGLLKDACDRLKERYPRKYDNAVHIYNNVEYCSHAAMTNSNYRQWCLMRRRYLAGIDRAEALKEMRAVLISERENVETAIPTLERDHMLGSCPSHGDMSTPENLRLKLGHIDSVLENELPRE